MGNTCCSCLQRKHSVDDLVDGSLEDKLLGQPDDGPEEARADEEAWRRRREEVKEDEDMSMNDDDRGTRTSLAWDSNDWNKAATLQKDASDFVHDDEDNEAFGSAEESAADDEEYQETSEDGPPGDAFCLDRLTQLTSRDSYASNLSAFREEESRVFRDTEIEGSPDTTSTFLAPRVSSSVCDSLTTTTFLESEDENVTELQKQEQEEQGEKETQSEVPRDSSSSSLRSRSAKKKKRSRKSMGK